MKFVCDNTYNQIDCKAQFIRSYQWRKKLIVGAQAVYAIILYKMKITKTFQKFNIHV